jgi:hypothetical protein
MRAQAGSPISTYFRVCDGVRVRFADTRADSDSTVLRRRGPKHCGPFVASGTALLESGGWSPSTCRDSATPMVARN